jgi:glutaredoxin 3
MNAVVYTRENCIFCTKAKELLNNNNISYEEYILDVFGRDNRPLVENQHWSTKDELLQLCPTAKTVPQIWLDGKYVGGFTELSKIIQ